MRTIASLLFGRDAGELLDLITGEGGNGERHAGRPRGGRPGAAVRRVVRQHAGAGIGRPRPRGRAARRGESLSATAGYNAHPARVNPICPWYERRVAGYACADPG